MEGGRGGREREGGEGGREGGREGREREGGMVKEGRDGEGREGSSASTHIPMTMHISNGPQRSPVYRHTHTRKHTDNSYTHLQSCRRDFFSPTGTIT